MHEYQLLIEGYPLPVTGTDIDTTKFVYTKDLYQEVRIIHILVFIKYCICSTAMIKSLLENGQKKIMKHFNSAPLIIPLSNEKLHNQKSNYNFT